MKKLIFLSLILIIIDQISKLMSTGKNIIIIKNLFYIRYSENPGLIFGIFSKSLFFTIILPIILIIILIYYYGKDKNLGIIFIIAGLIGNLIDRFLFGFVKDFIFISIIPKYNISLFNLADAFLIIGIIILIFRLRK